MSLSPIIFLFFMLFFPSYSFTKPTHATISKVKQWCLHDKPGKKNPFPIPATLSFMHTDGSLHVAPIEILEFQQERGFLLPLSQEDLDLINKDKDAILIIFSSGRQVHIEGRLIETTVDITQKKWKALPQYLRYPFIIKGLEGGPVSLVPLTNATLSEKKRSWDKEGVKQQLPPHNFCIYGLIPKNITFYLQSGRLFLNDTPE